MKSYTVAVRTLCEFAAKQGDLDLRFTPSPSSQQGISGHRTVAASRSASYRSELRLSGQYRHLVVRGRADGYDADRQLLEEVKTYVGELDLMPANHRHLHWAQAKVYGALACREFRLAGLTVALVYFDVGRQQEAPPLLQHCTAIELQAFFEALCERFIAWADAELAHRERRDAALGSLKFPHAEFRAGQRDLASGIQCGPPRPMPAGAGTDWHRQDDGHAVPDAQGLPWAGTRQGYLPDGQGLGPIAGVDGAGNAPPERTRAAAARRQTGRPGEVLRASDKTCHGDSCPLARGFYDRLPAARAAQRRPK